MSRHIFEATTSDGTNVFVVAGWDRPLQQFFLDVELIPTIPTDINGEPDETYQESEYLYESSTDMYALGSATRDWSFYASILDDLGICLPSQMVSHIRQDKDNDIGNLARGWN